MGRHRHTYVAAHRAWITVFTVLLLVFSPMATFAQSTLSLDVQDALSRINTPNYSAADQALLFANNDAVNAARQNGEISDAYYQAAQADYDELSQGFAKEAAVKHDAKFEVQTRTSSDFMPGTDSDYITEVTSKEQIRGMQEDYNRQVNEFLENNLGDKAPEARPDWHNKLDVDFMADPTVITDPDEFREIAKLNNDAYKNRFAAQYEKISRQKGGGKIGPEHVNGYMSEMERFADKKRGKVEEMLARPSELGDPQKRAELFRTMAQEQKYNSRIESLDDYLRAQEGLPPRNRGVTSSKLGSNRSPGNTANIRSGSAVAEAARADALENLAETMAQVSLKNPAFDPNTADSIAYVIEKLPPSRRVEALAKISANGRPGLIDNIIDASRRAGRLTDGASLADDIARAGSKFDEAVDLANRIDTFAHAGSGRRAINPALEVLDAVGRAANAAEAVAITSQLAGLLTDLDRALDPDTPPDVAQALLEDIRARANELRDSAILGALMERYPPVAIIYGGLAIGCLSGELVSPSREAGELGEGASATGSCMDRQVAAMQRFGDWLTGEEEIREQNREAICQKFREAVDAGRAVMKDDWTVDEACQWIRYGNPIDHMFDRNDSDNNETNFAGNPEPEPEPQITPETAADDVAARIETLFAAVEGALANGESARSSLADQCAAIPETPDTAGASGGEEELLATIRAAIQQARARTNQLNNIAQTNQALTDAVSRARERAAEESGSACGFSAGPDTIASIRDAAFNARNHAVLANQVGREAVSLIDGALTGPDAALPHPGDLAAQIAAASPDTPSICGAIGSLTRGTFVTNTAAMAGQQALTQLGAVFALLKHPNLADEDQVNYTLRYAGLQQRAETLVQSTGEHEACAARFMTASSACNLTLQDGDVSSELVDYTAAYTELQSARAANQPALNHARDRISLSMADAENSAGEARTCFEDAEQNLLQADTELDALMDLEGLACSAFSIDQRINALSNDAYSGNAEVIDLVSRLRNAANTLRAVDTAIRDDRARVRRATKLEDLDGIPAAVARTRAKLQSLPSVFNCRPLHVANDEILQRAQERRAELETRVETFAEAVDRCEAKYGERFSRVVGDPGDYRCRFCNEGTLPKDGRCYTPQELGDIWCNENNDGSGWQAYNFNGQGGHSCRLTQAAADRWCNANNDGSGWVAEYVSSTGNYNCRLPEDVWRQRAVNECRAVARNNGKVYAFTQFKNDGSYDCRWCEPGFYYANGRCHARQQQVQQTQPRQQPESGPLYRCNTCGAGTIMGCTSGVPEWEYSTWEIPGAQCQRVR